MTPNRLAFAALAAVAATAAGIDAQTSVHHHFAFAVGDSAATVTVTVENPARAKLALRMPAWSPGYTPGVRRLPADRACYVRATADSTPTGVSKVSTSRWSVDCAGVRKLTLRYRVPLVGRKLPAGLGQREPHDYQRDGKKATVRYHEAFLLHPGATFFEIEGAKQRVSFDLPPGFRVAAVLPKAGDGSYSCADYTALLDAPFHIGKFEELGFEAGGKPHRIVLSGFSRARFDRKELTARFQALVDANRSAMGPLPYASFVFMVGRRSGNPTGVGHLTATELLAPTLRPTKLFARAIAHAHLAAFEGGFFRPEHYRAARLPERTLGPEAWFWLGLRDYLSDLALVRAGIEEPDDFWTRIVNAKVTRLQSDRRRLESAVSRTGQRMVRPGEIPGRPGAPKPALVGFLLCLLLDVEIRANTAGARSIADAARALAAQCATRRKGYVLRDIRECCQKTGGRDFAGLFACVNEARELPLTAVLAKAGIHAAPVQQPKPRKDGRVRRRPPRWRVRLESEPTAAARRVRDAITGR